MAEPEVEEKTAGKKKPKRQPRYHVILWNDEDHSYDYVIKMMKELFGHGEEAVQHQQEEHDGRGEEDH